MNADSSRAGTTSINGNSTALQNVGGNSRAPAQGGGNTGQY